MGKEDWTKTFVSKLLVTHQGNCHSLPYLYKILADEMGAKAWLSLAPNHIYIKNQSQKISWYNTELTSATFPIDAWLMASGYITYESVVNRVYMDTLGVKQSLALCLVDLAQGYQRKQVNYNPDFALKCVDLALQYYPQYINALLLKADILKQLSVNKAQQDSQTTQELIGICDKIYDLGYREMPESMYLEWLSGDKYKAPDSVRTQNAQKGNPFGYKKEVLTLSNGRYDEFQQKERFVKIGWVMYDTERKVISEYLSPNPEKIQIAPELVSRFLSVDPIGREFPELTPYSFVGNMPIIAIDPDGQRIVIKAFDREHKKQFRTILRVLKHTSQTAKETITSLQRSKNIHTVYLAPHKGSFYNLEKLKQLNYDPRNPNPGNYTPLINYKEHLNKELDKGNISQIEYNEAITTSSILGGITISNTDSKFWLTGSYDFNSSNGTGTGSTMYLHTAMVENFIIGIIGHEIGHQKDNDNGQLDGWSRLGGIAGEVMRMNNEIQADSHASNILSEINEYISKNKTSRWARLFKKLKTGDSLRHEGYKFSDADKEEYKMEVENLKKQGFHQSKP
jgi:hypothetical protein